MPILVSKPLVHTECVHTSIRMINYLTWASLGVNRSQKTFFKSFASKEVVSNTKMLYFTKLQTVCHLHRHSRHLLVNSLFL